MKLALIIASLSIAAPALAITPALTSKIVQKTPVIQVSPKSKPLIQQPAMQLPASVVRNSSMSPAFMMGICKGLQETCALTFLAGGNLIGPIEDMYPIDWLWQCAEQQMPECAQYRMRSIVKEVRSPPAPQPPFVVGNVGYAIVCEAHSGECSLRYYTDFSQFQWPVWHAENNCFTPTPPLPDENTPDPPPCDPVSVDQFQVAIEGQMAMVEVGGTLAGCIVPRVQGAYPPSHRNFNRRQDYTEVTANQIAERRNCRGSYRIELQNGRVCNLPCYYSVEHLLAGVGGEFGCYIGFYEPTCR